MAWYAPQPFRYPPLRQKALRSILRTFFTVVARECVRAAYKIYSAEAKAVRALPVLGQVGAVLQHPVELHDGRGAQEGVGAYTTRTMGAGS